MDFRTNLILIFIIAAYLFYSFIKTRQKIEKEPVAAPKETAAANGITDYEKHVVAAVIADLMHNKRYIIKSVFAVGQVNEKKSAWKVSGRQESMNKRLFFRKK